MLDTNARSFEAIYTILILDKCYSRLYRLVANLVFLNVLSCCPKIIHASAAALFCWNPSDICFIFFVKRDITGRGTVDKHASPFYLPQHFLTVCGKVMTLTLTSDSMLPKIAEPPIIRQIQLKQISSMATQWPKMFSTIINLFTTLTFDL